ncbi:MAG: hypothetical protein WA173_07870 [Pseudomonas sp.]|uniref:PA4575 family protein n=1 Tax=Pseudomonas sp. TaxID=306 RepID=UPI003BB55A44
MSPSLCLTRQYLGVVTRIECAVRPLAGNQGHWVVLCVAGMDDQQPSVVNAQGPFCGPCAAQEILAGITASLQTQGYRLTRDVPIWCLHMQAKMRQLNGLHGHPSVDFQSHPER